ncbi:polyphenol oxidase family protein [Propionibacterium sp.]|uniref:polyphenol oxidase family protein n=1 Tax=Propionibacterium sp. TaxID=1977903 RepID=UPI0039EAFC2F
MFSYLSEPGTDGIGLAFTDRLGGFSTGQFTSFNLGHTDEDSVDALRANMAMLRDRLGLGPVSVVKQVHGRVVIPLGGTGSHSLDSDSWLSDAVPGVPALVHADAQVTTLTDTPLAVRVADCVPVLLADRAQGVLGSAHAGRVGLLAGVLQETVAAMRLRGARRLEAWIGPHICGRCYEVPAQMQAQACAVLPELRCTTSWGTPSLDLGSGAQGVLERDGVTVHRLDPCTRTGQAFFSHRGDHGRTGNQIGLIWRVARHVGRA